MGDFIIKFSYDQLSAPIVEKLKIHLLDSMGCIIAGLDGQPVLMQRKVIEELGGNEQCTLVGSRRRTAVDRAAQHLTALTRYLDFMDNFIAKHGTCHPSDNIGSMLAVGELLDADGKQFLEAMALAYNVQCRMIEIEPAMELGFDHTTQLSYSIAAGVSKLLGLNKIQAQNAVSMSGSTFNPLVVTRAPHTSHWKGILSSHLAFGTVNCCLMAQKGMTGPIDVFEGVGGYNKDFKIKKPATWDSLRSDLYEKLIIKKYNSEVHTQPSVEATLRLRRKINIDPADIRKIEVQTFLMAYNITGGGKYGPRKTVYTKEEADHSLPYIVAVALLDGEVTPRQYTKERIMRDDVQKLLQLVEVRTKLPFDPPKKIIEWLDPYTRVYPEKAMSCIKVTLKNGKTFEQEVDGFHGYPTYPFSWEDALAKYRYLTAAVPAEITEELASLVRRVEQIKVRDLLHVLAKL
jgi:2-methylcitrate dehydratase